MKQRLGGVLLITMAVVSVGAISATGGGATTSAKAGQQKPIRYEQDDLFIEYNASAGDAGLQLSLDAEDWRRFRLLDTERDRMVDLNVRGRLRRFGLTELFFEASEPSFTEFPFSRFKRRFPEGRYRFRGLSVGGRPVVGSDRLSHLIPAAPKVTFPTRGARVDPAGFDVTWEPVTRPTGVKIASYQVIVIQGDRELSMYLPPGATSATIPGQFLAANTKTEGEVLAREKSGNQTIRELPPFRTR